MLTGRGGGRKMWKNTLGGNRTRWKDEEISWTCPICERFNPGWIILCSCRTKKPPWKTDIENPTKEIMKLTKD